MLRPDGVVKVLDFGLAKLAPASAGGCGHHADGLQDRRGNGAGHRWLHVARAGPWPGRRREDRHLVARCDALRDGRRPEPLRGTKCQRRARRHPAERARARCALRAGRPGRTASHPREDTAEGPLAAISNRPGPAPGPAGASRRCARAGTPRERAGRTDRDGTRGGRLRSRRSPRCSRAGAGCGSPGQLPRSGWSACSACGRGRRRAERRRRPRRPARPSSAPSRVSRLDRGCRPMPTFSPDGRFVAYASDRSGNFDIWVQPMAGGDAVQITRSLAQETQPDWSPDGANIVFRSDRDGGGLFVMPALGGSERRLTTFGAARAGPAMDPKSCSSSNPSRTKTG